MTENIESFSFRYGDTGGRMEWFRCEKGQGLWLEQFDGERRQGRCDITEADLAELERVIQSNHISDWNGFCRLDLGMCSGNSWVLHVTYTNRREIHAMGHSEAPEGFAQGKAALEAFFAPFWEKCS